MVNKEIGKIYNVVLDRNINNKTGLCTFRFIPDTENLPIGCILIKGWKMKTIEEFETSRISSMLDGSLILIEPAGISKY